jgi:predicted PolB exonuclease-like 3'-5' exonuclease
VTPILVFDIETIPDVDGLRRLHADWKDLSDAEVADLAYADRREKVGTDFLQHHLHRIAAISCTIRDDRGFRVRSLGEPGEGEAKLIGDFFKLIDHYTPQLVSWNGGGFDLPVLHYRAMVHGITAGRYWELGDEDRDFKWNNYISRYHMRHCDLMDLLAMYAPRASAPLDDLARLCGFPGKLGMDGSQVWPAYQAGQIVPIRQYCETDVVNTYLLFCRFRLLRGALTPAAYAEEIALVRSTLQALPDPHWQEYLAAWPE